MIDAEKLTAFALLSGMTSLIPGPSMIFVMGQAIWRGGSAGAAALAGVQFGYLIWWLLAGLGLGTLAVTAPFAFSVLAVAGAAYLAWLGIQALRHAGEAAERGARPLVKPSRRAFLDGLVVAIGNPKALMYMVALLPPFVDPHSPVVPQLMLLAAIAITLDVAFGALYILAGNRLANAVDRPSIRIWLDRTIGAIFLAIALVILADLLMGSSA